MAPVSVGSCYVLPVSPATDGSSRQIQNYLETVKGLEGYPTFEKNVDVPTCAALFYILHYTSLNGIYRSLEYCAVELKTKAGPLFQASSIHPSTSSFIGLGPVHIPDWAPFSVCVEPILPSHLSGNLILNGLWYAYTVSVTSCQTPSVGWVCGGRTN